MHKTCFGDASFGSCFRFRPICTQRKTPNLVRTVRQTIYFVSYLSSDELLVRRTFRRTMLRFLTDIYYEMQASARTCGSIADYMIQNACAMSDENLEDIALVVVLYEAVKDQNKHKKS